MHVEHQHHRGRRDELIGELEANTNSHGQHLGLVAGTGCKRDNREPFPVRGRLRYKNMGMLASNFLCRIERMTCSYFGRLIVELSASYLGSILSKT